MKYWQDLLEAALAQAEQSLKDGAESMRPGAEIVSAEEETRCLLPAVLTLKQSFPDAIRNAGYTALFWANPFL